MKNYNDIELDALINAGKKATNEINALKLKSQIPMVNELKKFRRSRLQLIRKRATQLNLTQTDLDMIHAFIQTQNEL